MSKLNQWLTLVANLSVVAGIIFLAVELRQNTAAIRAQTRDALTEKQIEIVGWQATVPELATIHAKARNGEELSTAELLQLSGYVLAQFREWENSHYQFSAGLFSPPEFEARRESWRILLSGASSSAYITTWQMFRLTFAPSFRADIDRLLAELDQA